MPIYNTIKIECDSKLPARRAVDTQTEKTAEFWLFNNLKFGVVLLCNDKLFSDFSNVSKLVLGVKECDNGGYPLESDTFEILKEVAAADISATLTETQRADGSVHAMFEIGAEDIAATMKAGMKWLVVQAVDSSGGTLTFFGGNILCKNDASSGTASGATLTRFDDYKTACENAQAAAAGSAASAQSAADGAYESKQAAADSAAAAASSATNAGTMRDQASTMVDAAESYAVQANTASATATAQANAAASSATAAQQAAAQATAISDPEGWRTATSGLISDLAASKTNIGTFHFGSAGGALQTTGNPMYGVVDRSYCMTLELDEDWNLNATTSLWLNLGSDGIRSSTLEYGGVWCQLRSRSNTNVLQITYGDGQNTYLNAFGNVVNVENIFGGSDNSIVPAGKYVVCICIHFGAGTSADPSKAYVYVNGALKATISGYGTTKSTNLNWVSGGKVGFFDIGDSHGTSSFSTFGHFEGKASRFAVFNFDMSAADTPYTVADYAAGKIPPLELCDANVQWGSFTTTGNNPTLTHGADDSFAAAITASTSTSILPSFNIPFKAKKGTKVRFRGTLSWTSSADDTLPLHFSIRNKSDASASAAPYEVSNGTAFDFKLEATDDIAYIGMRANGATGGSTITYTGTLHVERDAVVLAAADYAIARNSTTRLVKDITGNGNDLTVCGDVVGDKDAAVAAFIDELKTQISQNS